MRSKFDIEKLLKLDGVVAAVVEDAAGTWLENAEKPSYEWGGPLSDAMKGCVHTLRTSKLDYMDAKTTVDGDDITIKVEAMPELGEIIAVAVITSHPSVKSLVRAIRNAKKAAIKAMATSAVVATVTASVWEPVGKQPDSDHGDERTVGGAPSVADDSMADDLERAVRFF